MSPRHVNTAAPRGHGLTLLESGRSIGSWHAARTVLGMATHLLVLSAVAVLSSLEYRRAVEAEPDAPRPVYLAPEKQEISWPKEERLSQVALTSAAEGDGPPAASAASPVDAVGSDQAEEVTIPTPAEEEFVLTEIEVDSAVVPDPESGGPAYPPEMLKLGVEGTVLARFVVDTFGRAETKSFLALQTTNQAFADAVRASLPQMKFRPARLAGKAVPQLVVQSFAFRIQTPPPPDTIGRPRPDTMPARSRRPQRAP